LHYFLQIFNNKKIQERDKQIGEKERKIYELKKRSQELEKFKFVLDHKIKELKRDIGPREEEITRMKKVDLKNFSIININNLFYLPKRKQTKWTKN
jgi:uncharacterized protein (DUF3084 family)